jgi:Helicase associated domain
VDKIGARLTNERIARLTQMGVRWYNPTAAATATAAQEAEKDDDDDRVSQEEEEEEEEGEDEEGDDELVVESSSRQGPQQQWEAMALQLEQFQRAHGHCIVPRKYRPNQRLANWLVSAIIHIIV